MTKFNYSVVYPGGYDTGCNDGAGHTWRQIENTRRIYTYSGAAVIKEFVCTKCGVKTGVHDGKPIAVRTPQTDPGPVIERELRSGPYKQTIKMEPNG